MKLHFPKILLFFFPSNILVTSYHVYNKNKIYITPHHTQTNRSLCECDIKTSIYDNDEDMKSVKENFDRQTSQRFEEYEERMITQRQKYKEKRDKNIQKIIHKDKMVKNLEEKIEKGCLRCGCGLGVVAAGVGIIGPIAVKGLENAALLVAAQKGVEAGIAKAIKGLGEIYGLSALSHSYWAVKINGTNFLEQNSLVAIVNGVYNKCTDLEAPKDTLFCQASYSINSQVSSSRFTEVISQEAARAARAAGEAAKNAEKAQIALVNEESTHLYSAIGYSVIAILIIVLVMVIIYLILRYRRKKKMNKKLQYTKLLNQ